MRRRKETRETMAASVQIAANIKAILACTQQCDGKSAQQVKHLGFQEIMVPVIACGIVGDHEQVICRSHKTDVSHKNRNHHEYAKE